MLGQAGDLGAIAPRAKADLVLLRDNSVFLRPMADPVKTLVYAETGASVDTVAIPSVLAVYNWPRDTESKQRRRRGIKAA